MKTIYKRKPILFYKKHLIAAVLLLLILICTISFYPFRDILFPLLSILLTSLKNTIRNLILMLICTYLPCIIPVTIIQATEKSLAGIIMPFRIIPVCSFC